MKPYGESHQVFASEREDAYTRYQVEREDEPLNPGVAVPLVLKLPGLNRDAEPVRVEVILLSRNSTDIGPRIFNSIRHHGLDINPAAFTRGASPYRYLLDFDAQLFLSTSPEDVSRDSSIHIPETLESGDDAGGDSFRGPQPSVR